jgi:hypothetical protein
MAEFFELSGGLLFRNLAGRAAEKTLLKSTHSVTLWRTLREARPNTTPPFVLPFYIVSRVVRDT